jgi:CPA1 family monovalent cation:H+ antiporter
MEFALIGVVAVVTIVAVSAFSRQLGIAAPLVLVLVGIAYSFIPGVPPIHVPPWLILEAVLPPLLYSAAVQVPLVDFRRNIGSIATLSVLLVFGTAIGIGFLLYAILPGLDLAAAIALGAVVSPTDAVAATAIAKRLGLPGRLITMLEGESLVNDASALVLLKTAIAATGASISALQLGGDFALSTISAIAAGLIVGVVTVWLRSKLHDSMLETAVSFAVPFIAYIPVEFAGASGLLAVVVAGIYTGHRSARAFTAQSRISERLNWRTVQFLLENGVFLLIGAQLRTIVEDVQSEHDRIGVWGSVLLGLLVMAALLLIRVLFIAPLLALLRDQRRRAKAAKKRVSGRLKRLRSDDEQQRAAAAPVPGVSHDRQARLLERRSADLSSKQRSAVGARSGLVLTWAGMRGVVTLAAAQSLPKDTPYQPQLVLIAVTVTIVSLLLQGGTLPWLIRATGVRGSDAAADRRELAELLDEIKEAGTDVLEHPRLQRPDGQEIDPGVIERLRENMLRRSESAWERAEHEDDDDVMGPHQQYRELLAEVLDAQRNALLEARSRGSYRSRILAEAQSMLDLEESRLNTGDR